MVGAAGFELATLCSQDRCATTALSPDTDALLPQLEQKCKVSGVQAEVGEGACVVRSDRHVVESHI